MSITKLETELDYLVNIEGLAKAITASGQRNITATMLRRRLLALGGIYLPFDASDDVRDAEACTVAIADLDNYKHALISQRDMTEADAVEWMVGDFTGEVEDEMLEAITGSATQALAVSS